MIASALIPRFKLQWLPSTEQFDVEAWLKAEFENEDNRNSDSQNENEEENKDKVDDFFGDILSNSYSAMSDEQLNNFLHSNNKDLKMIFNFPKVLKKFLYYNTGLPSSASVERLFSTGGNIMSLKRFSLTDNMFETLVMLKQNKTYI